MKFERTVAPVNRVVEWAEASDHLRSPDSSDQTYVESLIDVVTANLEEILNRALITQTWALYLDKFPVGDEIELPRPKLQSVSSISYVDENGSNQTFSSSLYQVDTKGRVGKVKLVDGQDWPGTKVQLNAVTITFVAGYGATKADVPSDIKHAVLLLVSHLYRNRQEVVYSPGGAAQMLVTPKAANALLANHRVF